MSWNSHSEPICLYKEHPPDPLLFQLLPQEIIKRSARCPPHPRLGVPIHPRQWAVHKNQISILHLHMWAAYEMKEDPNSAWWKVVQSYRVLQVCKKQYAIQYYQDISVKKKGRIDPFLDTFQAFTKSDFLLTSCLWATYPSSPPAQPSHSGSWWLWVDSCRGQRLRPIQVTRRRLILTPFQHSLALTWRIIINHHQQVLRRKVKI